MIPRERLISMLSYRRPAGSSSEAAFINRFIRPIPGIDRDAFGNWFLVIGDAPSTLFSAHTDSVHYCEGRQHLRFIAPDTVMSGDKPLVTSFEWKGKTHTYTSTKGGCLGADDAAGCFLLIELIHARIPGRYIFHRAEEKGGIGSGNLVGSRPDWLPEITHAIAFDRRGRSDIITHQSGGRTASDAFALDFADRLLRADPALVYSPCEGIFTDTANYAEDVAECTNLSVGYFNEHHSDESLDIAHVLKLRNALIMLDWRDLVVDRDPADWHDWVDETLAYRHLTTDEIDVLIEQEDTDRPIRSHDYLYDEYRDVQQQLAEDMRARLNTRMWKGNK